jgi:hypothetical protein
MTSFNSVSTGAARFQDISMNPQKLAGQCAKLKCCMNYEVDVYVEAMKRFPARDITLETLDSTYYHFKSDILKYEITYSTDKSFAANLVTISTRRAFEIINLNKKGVKPESLLEDHQRQEPQSNDLLDQDSLTRFDSAKKKKKKKKASNRSISGKQGGNNNNKEPKRPEGNNDKKE